MPVADPTAATATAPPDDPLVKPAAPAPLGTHWVGAEAWKQDRLDGRWQDIAHRMTYDEPSKKAAREVAKAGASTKAKVTRAEKSYEEHMDRLRELNERHMNAKYDDKQYQDTGEPSPESAGQARRPEGRT